MKHKCILILTLCGLLFLLSACSYKEFEDSLKDKLNESETDEYVNPSKIPDKDSETKKNNTTDVEEQILFDMGETVIFTWPDGTIQYRVNQVNVVDNIKKSELKKDDFSSYQNSYILDNGDITNNQRLLTLDITVKNIDYTVYDEEYENIALNIEGSLGFKSGIEDPNGPFSFEPAYFSGHPTLGRYPEDGYLYFPLEIGEEVDVTVGWFIHEDEVNKEPLYYIIGAGGFFEERKYIEVNID